jgi:[ribosomal protein S18]-alanine N-acetyltransferase
VLHIRQVKPEDIFTVIKIAHNALPERYNPVIFNQFYEGFPDGFLIAEQNHKIIGFIIGVKTFTNVSRILMLAVVSPQRKKNIGSTLLSHFIDKMRMLNIMTIELEVRTNNTAAINFYKKHNFTIEDTIYGFYQNGENAYTMKRNLRMH